MIDEYIDFYYALFGKDNRFSFLFRPAGDWGGEAVKSYADCLLEENSLSAIFQKMLKHPQALNISRHLAFLNPGGSMCIAAKRNTLLIDSEGSIRKCSCHLDDDNNLIGQIQSNGGLNIDLHRSNQWMFFKSNEEKCAGCSFMPSCLNNSCPANYILGRGDTNKCTVYEKNCLDEILLMLDKQGVIPEAEL